MNEILKKIKKYSTPLKENIVFEDNEISLLDANSLINQFSDEAQKVGSKIIICNSANDAGDEINKIIQNYESVVFNNIFDKSIFEKIKTNNPNKNIFKVEDIENDIKANLSKIKVSISIPEYLIAETGTAIIRTSKDEPRLLSILPEISIIFARKDQIIPSMSHFLKKSKNSLDYFRSTSAYIFITGPSRTADIEKNLVIGVHGPGELVYILY